MKKEKERFWNPTKPTYPSNFAPSRDRGECYTAALITVLLSWGITVGSLCGLKIPPFLEGLPWWGWVILFIVGCPIFAFLMFMGFYWMACMCDLNYYLDRDTWRAAEKLRPLKPAPIVRLLGILQFTVFLPFLLIVICGIIRQAE